MTEYLTKSPTEERAYALLHELDPGESVVEDLGWTIVPDEMDAQALSLVSSSRSGATATALLAGGRAGHLYHVSNRARTSAGRVVSRALLVRVTAG